MMDRTTFLKAVQRYVANVGISGSSLRNQGAKGVVDAARQFLAALDLTPLKTLDPAHYPDWLDRTTDDLLRHLPAQARRWGAARKAINIFMVQASFNRELSAEFCLVRLVDVMETPLDKMAAKELGQMEGGDVLDPWPGFGKLKADVSGVYQEFASQVAKKKQVPRGHLDVILWRPAVE